MVAVHEQTQVGSDASDRRLPHLDIALVALVVGFSMLGLRPLIDPDLWWHLRTGELVLESGFPGRDPWSFASTNDWLLHEWGTEAVMFAGYKIAGYKGVILLHGLAMLVLGGVLADSIRRVSSARVAVPVTFLTMVGVFLGTAERPQLVSWILLAAVLPRLSSSVAGDRACWWLVPVVWLWANLHGLWIVALALYLGLVVGRLLDRGWRSWRLSREQVAAGALAGLSAALTPNGPALLLEPFHVRGYGQFVGEWGSPNLQNPFFAATYLMLGLLLIAWGRSKGLVPYIDIAMVIAASVIGLAYIRTMPVLAIALGPVVAAALEQWSTPSRQSTDGPSPMTDRRWLAGVLATFVVISAAWLPFVPSTKVSAPRQASVTLDRLPGRVQVLNQYDLGGWMLWTARDSSPVIDGRTEIYSINHVAETLDAINLEPGWQRYVKAHDFDAALLRDTAPLVSGLRSLGWTTALDDHGTLVMIPPPTP